LTVIDPWASAHLTKRARTKGRLDNIVDDDQAPPGEEVMMEGRTEGMRGQALSSISAAFYKAQFPFPAQLFLSSLVPIGSKYLAPTNHAHKRSFASMQILNEINFIRRIRKVQESLKNHLYALSTSKDSTCWSSQHDVESAKAPGREPDNRPQCQF